MPTSPRSAARTGALALTAALPLPELPAGMAQDPRVLQLIDLDDISRGLADGAPRGRASDQAVRMCLDIVHDTARALDSQARVRCAASAVTAACHFDLLTASGSNEWLLSGEPEGADLALLTEMTHLIDARLMATGPGRKRPVRLTDLVILVGRDHIYARPVRRLRLLGIPTWLIVPGRRVATSLYACSCAVSFLGPDLIHPVTGMPMIRVSSPPLLPGRRP